MTANNFAIVGDVGGTNCRFAYAARDDDGQLSLSNITKLSTAEFDDFDDALAHYLSGLAHAPAQAAFAMAGPKFDRSIKMTNLAWAASEGALEDRFSFKRVTLANDFAAMARGAVAMGDDAFEPIIDGGFNYKRAVAVLGPGTGLGVAGVLPGHPPQILPTEGGYSAFAPGDDLEIDILKWLMEKFDFVATEHVLSGPGLFNIYQALCDICGESVRASDPSDVVLQANAEPKSLAHDAVRVFCNVLGGFAGNTAYTLGASGGVIIAGGVARHIAPFIKESDFETRFKSRGRAAWFAQNIPVRLLTAHSVALYGAAALIEDQTM